MEGIVAAPSLVTVGALVPGLRDVAGPGPYQEGGFFLIAEDRSTWVFAMSNPTPREIEAIRTGSLKFSFVIEPPALCMIVESSVFCAERTFLSATNRNWRLPASTRYDVVLVDARDGMALAARSVNVGQDFADRVVDAINEQARVPMDWDALALAEARLASRSVQDNARRAAARHVMLDSISGSTFRPPSQADGMALSGRADPIWDVGIGPARPFELMRRYGALYPGIWQQVDLLRQSRWWPRWCFLPMIQAQKLIGGQRVSAETMDRAVTAGVLLASWRLSKGVYVFDQYFAHELGETDLAKIPTEVIFRMPEQCVYIPVSWPSPGGPIGDVHGFFAQIQLHEKNAIPQLAFCFDTSQGAIWAWIDLIPNAVLEWGGDETANLMAGLMRRALPLLLYLCTETPDIDGVPRGEVQPTKTKKGLRWFPAEKIATWNVGVRLGATLRKAHEGLKDETADGTTRPHGRPRPHVRRAHFHSFWVGRKDQPEDRKLISRWVHDTLVNVKNADELVTTVRPVENP